MDLCCDASLFRKKCCVWYDAFRSGRLEERGTYLYILRANHTRSYFSVKFSDFFILWRGGMNDEWATWMRGETKHTNPRNEAYKSNPALPVFSFLYACTQTYKQAH